jgi:Spy/CpxP family protein refolding chaperone
MFGRSVFALGALCFLTSPAMAQGRGGMGMGGAALYANGSVQKELKFTEDQAKKAKEVVTDLREKYQDKLQEARQSQDFQAMQKINGEMTAEAKKMMADVLKPEQTKRFDEISLQQRGLQAFQDPEILKKIPLTDDQKAKFRDLGQDMQSQMQELRQGFQDDPEGTRTKMNNLRKETNTKMVALLTDDQKKTWKEMTGQPFDVKPDPPRAN